MKKVISFVIIALALVLVFTACKKPEQPGDEPAKFSQQLVDDAAQMIYDYNKPGEDNSVAGSFTLPKKVFDFEGLDLDIDWTVEGGDGLVTLNDKDAEKVQIIVDPYADKQTPFTVKGNVKGGEFSKEIAFNYVINEFKIADWAFWAENTKDVVMNIRGTVVAVCPYNDANKNVCVFLQDADGEHGYYAYRLKCESKDKCDQDLAVGNVIIVNGTTSIYNGFREMGSGCTYTAIMAADGSYQKGEVKEFSMDDLFNGKAIGDNLDPRQGLIGKITGATVKSIDWNSNNADNFYEKGSGSVYVTLTKNDTEFKLYLSTSNTLTVDELKAEYEKLAVGYVVDVKGPIAWYNGPQIYPMPGGITVVSTEVAPADKIASEFAALKLESPVKESKEIALPATGANYTDVAYEWTLVSGDSAKIENGKLVITAGDKADVINLKVKATCGSETQEKDIPVHVIPESAGQAALVDLLYSLEQGQLIEGPFTLTGVVTKIDTPYSDQYKNVSVIIVVDNIEDKPVLCYRLAGDGCDTIKEGDTITVEGNFKNYNGKFEYDAGCKLLKKESGGSGEQTEDPTPTPENPSVDPNDAAAVLNALYALGDNEALEGKYTLTGNITKIDTAWSDSYNNITVTIAVDGHSDKPVQCFRLTGDGAKDLKVGDNITVTGTLKHFNDGKNNTYEFDKGCTLDKVNSGSQPTETEQPPATEPPATDVGAILDVLYGLEDGKTTTETYTLSGTITKVDTPWNDGFKNITVTIVVDGYESKPVQCFRLAGDGAKDLKVGDKITVTGKFKNYKGTREFDAACSLDSIDYVAPAVETDEDKYKTPEEIVNALYALGDGEFLNGTFTLTGKITKIDTAWSDEHKNITVTIVVGDMTDKPVMCYRLKGTGAENLKVDDVITVKGQLKNYVKNNTSTYEFDAGCELLSVN